MRRCWQASPSFCCPGSPRGFVSLHAKSPNAHKNFDYFLSVDSYNFSALSKPAGVPGDTVPPALGNPGPESARPGQIVLAFIVWLLVVHKLKRALPVFKQFYQTVYSIQLSTSFPWGMVIYYVPLRGGTGLPAGTGRSLAAVIGSNRRRSVVAVEGTAGIEPAHPSCACRGCSEAMPILAPLPHALPTGVLFDFPGRQESNPPSDAGGIKTAALPPAMYEPAPGPQSLFLIFWNSGHSYLDPILVRKDLRHDFHQSLNIKHTLLPFPISWDICTHGLIIFSRCDTITSGRR